MSYIQYPQQLPSFKWHFHIFKKNDLNLKLNSYKIYVYIYIIFALQQSRDCKDEKWEKSQFYTAHYKPRWFHFRLLETKVIPIYHPKGFYSLYNHAQAPSGRAAPPKTFFPSLLFQLSNDDLDMWKLTWTEKVHTFCDDWRSKN